MESEFFIQLGRFARKRPLTFVPFAPEGRRFGTVASGVSLPEGGSCYVVEFDPEVSSRVRLLAYVDKYGRAFACSTLQTIPPAVLPQVLVEESADDENAGFVSVQSRAEAGALEPVISFTKKGSFGIAGDGYLAALTFGTAQACAEQAGVTVAFAKLPQALPYADFMAIAFLSLYLFLPETQPAPVQTQPPRPFDVGEILMRLNSSDLFKAVRREVTEAEKAWCSDDASANRGLERYLVRMLREERCVDVTAQDFAVSFGRNEEPVAPELRLIRTAGYANTFFIDFSYLYHGVVVEDGVLRFHPMAARARARLIGIEGALNRFLILADYLGSHGSGELMEDEGTCAEYDHWLIDRICVQARDPRTPEDAPTRWSRHFKFAQACEGLRLPYRFGYDFRTNVSGEALAANLYLPPLASFPKTEWRRDREAFFPVATTSQNAAYARYVAHLCLLVAAEALHVSAQLERVHLSCFSPDDILMPVMSVVFERSFVQAAFDADEDRAFSEPFVLIDAAGGRYVMDEDFSLSRIEPLFSLDDGEFAVKKEMLVCDEDVSLGDEVRAVLHVDKASDLNIFEDHARRKIAEEVVDALEGGLEDAMETLKSVHDLTEDLTVRRVCKGLMDDFAEGRLDQHSELEVREAFTDAYGFKTPITRAYTLAHEGDDVGAARVLEDLEAQVGSCSSFRDTSMVCYRYFDSYASRVIYANRCEQDRAGRRVLPLANEAYLVHDLYAQILTGSISNQDEALAQAKRCIELAPSFTTAYLRAARACFTQGDFAGEVRMCIKALELAWNSEDAGLAFYWLAFAYWKMERFELAVACYRRCITLGSHMADQAMEECAELVESVKGLQRHSPVKERELMLAAGIPADALRENGEYLLNIAEKAVESGARTLGTVLASSAARSSIRDDALLPTIRSLQG